MNTRKGSRIPIFDTFLLLFLSRHPLPGKGKERVEREKKEVVIHLFRKHTSPSDVNEVLVINDGNENVWFQGHESRFKNFHQEVGQKSNLSLP